MEGFGEDNGIHHRVLVLRDAALGLHKGSKPDPNLTAACYDSTVDSLLALYEECSQATALSKKKNVARFLGRYKGTVQALNELRITANDFQVKGIVGRGHFGEVQVVQERSTKEVYAMKIMKKAHILQQADSACFSEERDIMAWGRSPWLTCLHYAFQDPTSLYLVMDYHPGGDLLTIMERREGGMSEEEARFYLSEIGAGLNDLHQLGFVHRDVKPENVLISRSGHIKLVDFGSAARLDKNGSVVDSRLPVGTPEYIAPEVLTSLDQSGDYGVSCDWWSLGIIAYELIHVCTPFEGDSTTVTYSNIMKYKESLSFPEDVSTTDEFQALVRSLLTEPDKRLSFSELKSHPFFSTVDWEYLLTAIPPYIPSVLSPDDISNFDVFEPKKEDNLSAGLQPKAQREFSGKSLPFVGFTFTRVNHTQLDFTDSQADPVPAGEVSDWCLERAQSELKQLKERNSSLEKECVVYQSQLKDYSQRLERERSDRRQSDAKAIKLLEEVRAHGETLRELRKEELSDRETELGLVVQQLEQDRQVMANKARRLHSDLEAANMERDTAIKVAVELKAKLKSLKESSKKDISSLQSKFDQLNKESTQSANIHSKLNSAVEKYVAANKRLKTMEEAEKKQKQKIQKLERTVASHKDEVNRLKQHLETVKSRHQKQSHELEGRLETLTTERAAALQQCDALKQANQELSVELEEARNQSSSLVKTGKEASSNLQVEVRNLQQRLSRTADTAIKQSERLREVRSEKRALDLENNELKTRLSKYEANLERLRKEVEAKDHELNKLEQLQANLTDTQTELKSAQQSSEAMAVEMNDIRGERDSLLSEKRKVEAELQNTSDKLKKDKMSLALLKCETQMLREELTESKAATEELTAAQNKWRTHKATLTSDLETAETRLENALASLDKEKNTRVAAEKKQSELLARLEEAQSSHHEEMNDMRGQLDSQRQLMTLSDKKVLAVEKELNLTELTLKETRRDLDTEKACYSKIYEDLYSLNRDYGVLKAAYNKLRHEWEEQQTELTHTTELRDRVLDEQRTAAEAHQLQETRMQSTIEQQGKLIDYLQGVGTSPRAKGFGKLTKGLRLGRKGRDPAKEIAEWNKLKKYIGKPQKSVDMSQSSASSQELMSVSSVSSTDLPNNTPVSKSSQKPEHPPTAASPQPARITQSTVLTLTGSKKSRQETKKLLQLNKSPTATGTEKTAKGFTSESSNQENVLVTGKVAGKKRKRPMSACIDSELNEPAEKVMSIHHNIPHKFQLHKSGIHKAYKCVGCKEQIKKLQRYAKCTYCHTTCHPACMDSFPNNCGLPTELAMTSLPTQVTTDGPTTQKHAEQPVVSGNNETEQCYTDTGVKHEDSTSFVRMEPVTSRAGALKSEQVALVRGGLKTVGWLLLSQRSLYFYDRNPDNGATRKPLLSFHFSSSEDIFHILTTIPKLHGCSKSELSCAFGLRNYSSVNLDSQEVVFIVSSLQSKIEWVEAIGDVLSTLIATKEQLVYGDAEEEGVKETRTVTRKRSLKAVSIVPVLKRRSAVVSTSDSDLDLSIRSSMLDGSDSDNSSFLETNINFT